MTPRPLTKNLLKRMFLKTLWEMTRLGGKLVNQGYSWGIDSILGTVLPFEYKLKNEDKNLRKEWSLTQEEHHVALEGVEELDKAGFLRNDPSQSNPNFKLLTDKGKKYAEKELENMELPTVDLGGLLSHEDLSDAVMDDYMNGKYDVAIFNAFKMVEETVRAKAGLGPGVTGHDLMVAAFAPARPALTHPNAMTPAERQALFLLFDGCNGWFRNPTAHRTVGYQDPNESAQILGLANLLLSMVDKCT